MRRLLIAGCGDLGARLAGRLDPGRWAVTGLRRNPSALQAPIRPLRADLLDPGSLDAAAGCWDAVVYQVTPVERSEAGYRSAYLEGLANLFERIESPRLIFVSSTAVYGQDAGEWVDETSATEPTRFNGRMLLEAEALARRSAPEPVIVRFSGIYGPGRDYLLRRLRSGQVGCRDKPLQWTNRIHAEDCAGVLAHLLALASPEPVYCASDSHPAPRCEVLDWLAAELDVAPPPREDGAGGQGKRVANDRLLASGYRFIHPHFRSGYQEMLQ